MGSGFLVSAPLLAGVVGNLAVVCMAMLLVLAYLVGGAIRFNIRHFEPIENTGHGPAQDIAFLSRLVLTGAYFISVTYYLQLLAAFVLNAVGMDSQTAAHGITTLLLLTIGGIGMWRGLGELESVEKYTVSMNLGMIGALLVSLALYNVRLLRGGTWAWSSIASTIAIYQQVTPAAQRRIARRRWRRCTPAIDIGVIGRPITSMKSALGPPVFGASPSKIRIS